VNGVALWAGLAAFFANLLAVKVGTLFITDGNYRLGLSALFTSLAVAGAVYSRERLNEAKAEREHGRTQDEPSR
jgi:hypothetical protein